MQILDQIAQLILDDPYITAERIARKLGYAQEKTIYYWIDKGRFKGLTSFKRAVLGGQYHIKSEVKEEKAPYGGTPIARSFSPDGVPIFDSNDNVLSVALPAFAWVYTGPKMVDIHPHDALILAPMVEHHYHWAVVWSEHGRPELRIHIKDDNRSLFVHPVQLIIDFNSKPLYSVIQLIRKMV